MSGILLPLTVVIFLDLGQAPTLPDFVCGYPLLVGYVSIPYLIYHKQVNRGEMTGCVPQLIYLLFTGLVPGVLLLWYWDLIRWIQTRILKPDFEVKYSVNSKGMLRG